MRVCLRTCLCACFRTYLAPSSVPHPFVLPLFPVLLINFLKQINDDDDDNNNNNNDDNNNNKLKNKNSTSL